MKTYILNNSQEILLGTTIVLLFSFIVFNVLTHGIYNTASFEF